MKRVQTFQTNRKCFAFVGIVQNQSDFRYYPFSRKYLLFTSIFVISIISIWTFAFHVADSTKDYMDSFFVLIVTCSIFTSYTTVILNAKKLFCFYENCDEFLDDDLICAGNESKLRAKLLKTHQQVELLSKLVYFVMVAMLTSILVLPKTIESFYIYFTTDLDNEAFKTLFPLWIPFDWNNPFGYLFVVAYQSVAASLLLLHAACFASLALGAYLFVTSMNECMTDDLKAINGMYKSKSSNVDMFKQLSTFVYTHTKVKQMILEFSEIYETTLTLVFLCCTTTLSIAMLIIQIEITHDELDFFVLGQSIFYAIAVFGAVFFSCELGQRFTDSFGETEALIGKFDWNLFPIEIRRLLPMIIINVQEPVVIKCFGSVPCSRDQFKKVANTAYKYFMVLHKIYK